MSYGIGVLAAAVCYVLNRALFRRIGYRTVLFCSPVAEEFFKTVPAVWIGASILPVHIAFGAVEGAFELRRTANGRKAAAMSLAGHFLFGLATVTLFDLYGSVWWGLAAGCGLHVVWNAAVVRFT